MWTLWQARAQHLAARFPEVRGDLNFYSRLLEFQAQVYARADTLLEGETRPLERGTLMASLGFFSRYWREYITLWQERTAIEPLRRPTFDDLLELLTVYVLDDRIPRCVLAHQDNPKTWRALAKGLIQPAASVMFAWPGQAFPRGADGRCPRCRHWPSAATSAEGVRALHCSLCLFEWEWKPDVCVKCAGSIARIGSAGVPWVFAEACTSCKTYVKTGDRSVDPDCISFVDDLATPNVDRAARLDGFERIEPLLVINGEEAGPR